MSIKPLECYNRRFLIGSGNKLNYLTSKGAKLILPGQLFAVRMSHDGKKFRCILNDEVNKVFTLTEDDFYILMQNSISAEQAVEEGYLVEK